MNVFTITQGFNTDNPISTFRYSIEVASIANNNEKQD